MRYLHAMLRTSDLAKTLDFFCAKLGFEEVGRFDNEKGRFTLVFLTAPGDPGEFGKTPQIELTYNWDSREYSGGTNFGHLAYEVDDIYASCGALMSRNVVINRPPRDGQLAFIRSPDGISIELIQKQPALAPCEPWQSMPNHGEW